MASSTFRDRWLYLVRVVLIACLGALAGCATVPANSPAGVTPALREKTSQVLRAGVQYPHNPVVRAEAVEALEVEGSEGALPWIRAALLDEHPGVRYAACVALGMLRDSVSQEALRKAVEDGSPHVRAAAIFALHRLGQTAWTGRLPSFLLEHEDPAVRRNAALLIGRLGEPSAVPVLARAMKDAEPGVRQHALEALARLGNAEARQELIFMSNSGIGSEEVFAVNALAELRDARLRETFRFKLAKGPHLETKLASARALGMLGARDGLDAALRALRTPPSTTRDPADPPEDQRLRVRQLAASALGAIGGTAAVESLAPILEKPADPRLQVSAAKAVLEIERTGRGLHAAVHGPAALGRGTRHCQAALGRATRHWTPEDRRTR